MYLRSLEIKNYRSLQHAELKNFGQFNILIGRNNSGKSSVFGALELLNQAIHGVGYSLGEVLPARDTTHTLEYRLIFELRPEDRNSLLDILTVTLSQTRKDEFLNSPFYRHVEYTFRSHTGTKQIHLQGVSVRAVDGGWATVLNLQAPEPTAERTPYQFVKLEELVKQATPKSIRHSHMDVHSSALTNTVKMYPDFIGRPVTFEPAILWVLKRLSSYLQQAFFFDPFRHSERLMTATQADKLDQNGLNLARVLNTIGSNHRLRFSEIEEFIHAALPDIGALQTPLIGNNTEVAFRLTTGDFLVKLHEMGGGIEQLLMVATVLLTTNDENTLFLEEPESHLHAGAQRFLVDKLCEGSRQVFITTHSPTFINSAKSRSIYQVKINQNKTSVVHVNDAEALSETLEDIGSRNSDVLLSDAVLFVEGPSEQRVFELLSDKLDMSFEGRNVTLISMGGGEYGSRTAAVRTEVLEGISDKAPVPHLFVIDRDERSQSETQRLRKTLGEKFHVLSRRELENYFLIPRALIAALKAKHQDDAPMLEKLASTSNEQVEAIIRTTADSLYGLVLVKRLRATITGLKGGILPPDLVAALAGKVNRKDFAQIIRREIEARVKKHMGSLKIDTLVGKERKKLDKEWANTKNHLLLAPGEEVIAAVFHHFGSVYAKPNDTIRIAQEMEPDEIDEELKNLIGQAVALTEQIQQS